MNCNMYYRSLHAVDRLSRFLKNYLNKDTVIICIGTDKCIGDSLGPLVGTFLKEQNFPIPVYGTLNNPIHALNVSEKFEEIKLSHPDSYIIGIDACLGDNKSVGEIHVRNCPIRPGKGVGKILPHIGDLSIVGIVDCSKNSDIFTSVNIRLSFIFEIATVISSSLIQAFNINNCEIENGST